MSKAEPDPTISSILDTELGAWSALRKVGASGCLPGSVMPDVTLDVTFEM